MLLDEASLRRGKFQSGINTFEEWKKWEARWKKFPGRRKVVRQVLRKVQKLWNRF